MTPPTSKPTPAAPPSLRPYASQLSFGFFNATAYMVTLGTPMVLLASDLGATSFQVGLAYAFVYILLPVQIIATITLPRFGYKKQMIFAWSLRAFFLAIPLWITLQKPSALEPHYLHLFILYAFLYSLARSLGSCAVMPWFYARLPDGIRGRYFSMDQSVNAAAGILTLLFCATLFYFLPAFDAYFYQFLFATVCSGISVYCLGRIPSVPKPKETTLVEIAKETPTLVAKKSPFRQFLIFMIAYNLLGASFIPFTTYFLKVETGVTSSQIMIFSAIQYAGAIASSFVTRSRIDALGVKPILRFSLLLNASLMIFWLLYITGALNLRPLLPLAYFVLGVATTSWVASGLKYLPRVCSEDHQALHVSVHSAAVGLVAGLSPILWGILVKTEGSGLNRNAFIAFFVLQLLVTAVLYAYVPQLTSKYRNRQALRSSAYLLRPFRYFGQMINFLPKEKRDKETS